MKHLLYLLFVVFSFVACTPNQMSDKTVGGEDSIKTFVEKTVEKHCAIVNDNYDVVDKLDITGGCIHSFTENVVNEADIQTYDKYIYFMSGGEYGLRCSADSVYKESKILYIVKDTISNSYYGSEFYSRTNYSVDSTGHFVVGSEINDAFNVDSMFNRMRTWPFNDK